MHRLLAQENDHKRQAEEVGAKAAQHQRRALALRMRVEKMEVEMGGSGKVGLG
jgi:hypothetical protein